MNHYLIGGVVLETKIEFPELLKTERATNIKVEYGNTPETLEKTNFQRALVTGNAKGELLFKVPNIAHYFFSGNNITIQLLDQGRKKDAEMYILTFLFGAMSFKMGYFPLHGGGIVHNGKAYLFTGRSGAGKSTLLSALEAKGFQVLSDDISNLSVSEGGVIANPAYPRFKLWENSLLMLNKKGNDEYQLRSDMNKYMVPISNYSPDPIPVNTIYLLNENNNATIDIIPQKGKEKFNILQKNIYKLWMPKVFNLNLELFELTNKIAEKVVVKEFMRPMDNRLFNTTVDTIIKDIKNG